MELNFNPFPNIETERLYLRSIQLLDAPAFYKLRTDPAVLQFLGRAPAKDMQEIVDWIQQVQQAVANNELIAWGITGQNKNHLIGMINFWRIEKQHYRAEIGYMLLPEYWQNGIMNEALYAVIQYGFTTMKLHSIEANIDPRNSLSQKLLEKNGFVKEAHFKENYYFDGVFLDSIIYSLLAPS
jgi:ribosomal-protein-alanine N-acetyltransferase